MNRITIWLIFLIVISMVLPASAIMYASGQSNDNSDGSSTDGSTTDNSGSTTNDNSSSSSTDGGTTTDNSTTLPTTSTASNSTGNTQQQSNSTTLPTTSTASNSTGNTQQQSNSTTLPTTSTASNSTGNTQQQIKDNLDDFRLILQDQHFSQGINNTKIPPYCSSCDDNIYLGTGDYASMILAGHNRERAALGVAPLVWSNELASRAQAWVNYNIAHGTFTHCVFVPGNQQIEPCKYEDGENSAARNHCVHTGTCDPWKVPPAQMQEMWFAENPTDHWLQVVSKTATSIGCAYATGPSKDGGDRDLMYCRYSPAGLDVPGMICGGTCTEIKSP